MASSARLFLAVSIRPPLRITSGATTIPSRVVLAMNGSPMPFAPVPGVEQIGETIIGEACDGPDDGIAEERGQPTLARRPAPDCDRDVGTDDEATCFIRGMQPAAHVLERRPAPPAPAA